VIAARPAVTEPLDFVHENGVPSGVAIALDAYNRLGSRGRSMGTHRTILLTGTVARTLARLVGGNVF
jgi:hypothetical protein